MANRLTFIRKVIHEFEKNNLLTSLDNTSIFYDEPKYYYYSIFLQLSKKYMSKHDLYPLRRKISGGGISFSSSTEALSKCLGEAIERVCLASCQRKKIQYATYNTIAPAIDPSLYLKTNEIKNERFGWIEGSTLDNTKKVFIPAQAVFTDYNPDKEPYLCPHISTGAAGGFNHEETLLSGLQEVIERDAYMTMYLNKIPASKIDYTSISDKKFRDIVVNILRYNLELHIFDITNDLQIPTFMAILIDRTGLGPAITIGTKTGINTISTIIKAIAEALMSRPIVRYTMYQQKSSLIQGDKNELVNNKDRLFFWSSKNMITHIKFLLDQKPLPYLIKPLIMNSKEEISYLTHKLINNGFQPYYTDITTENFKKIPYKVYKVIVPGLQPLYLEEKKKYLNPERLATVAHFFGKKSAPINTIPHPFL